ncbi:MAG: hypothetical protein RIC87_07180 [Kiloniellales bacterium]
MRLNTRASLGRCWGLAAFLALTACSSLLPETLSVSPKVVEVERPCERAIDLLERRETLSLDGRELKAYAEACVDYGARPQLGLALLGRAEQYLGDRSASTAALNAALKAEPDAGPGVWFAPLLALDARATLFAARGDPLGALNEIEVASGLLVRFTGVRYPNLISRLLSERAAYLVLAGEEERAAADYERALVIARNPAQRFAVLRRAGWADLASGRFARAYRRLTQAYELAPAMPQKLQAALRIYAAEAQGLDRKRAMRGLERRVERDALDLDLYPGIIVRFLLDDIDAETLRQRAREESRLNPAAIKAQLDYYLGLRDLLDGESRSAQAAFARAVDSDVVALPEYFFARGAIGRL